MRSGSQCGGWNRMWLGPCVQRRLVSFDCVQRGKHPSVRVLRDASAHLFQRSMGTMGELHRARRVHDQYDANLRHWGNADVHGGVHLGRLPWADLRWRLVAGV